MTTSLPRAKTWYQRPSPSVQPVGFGDRLADTVSLLRIAAGYTPCVLAHSLSAEDMVLFHLIAQHGLRIEAIALDTDRLPKSTLELWRVAELRYSRSIRSVRPTDQGLQSLVAVNANSEMYENKHIRELCCNVRKTEPLRALLKDQSAWVTGLRRAQSSGRTGVEQQEFDASFGLEKFNPLASWTDEDLWFFVDQQAIPVNALYDRGYASIGCDPCTRPIRADEHPRAGRWWWEFASAGSECGIHVTASGSTSSNSTAGTHHDR